VQYLYCLLFRDGVTKVGVTRYPSLRLKDYRGVAESFIAPTPAPGMKYVELEIIKYFRDFALKGHREFFQGVSFEELKDIVLKSAEDWNSWHVP
jgi:hypothetical protein